LGGLQMVEAAVGQKKPRRALTRGEKKERKSILHRPSGGEASNIYSRNGGTP